MLQTLMSSPQWAGVEAYYNYYVMNNFAQSSSKRDTEFETIWELANVEGGKNHLNQFIKGMEQEANRVTT
ncbi:MAG: hypothetical protein DDT19_02904 [Syntrophomonadaceae bacterium]|nr:hypothetical protein [Bacillota bacterium]